MSFLVGQGRISCHFMMSDEGIAVLVGQQSERLVYIGAHAEHAESLHQKPKMGSLGGGGGDVGVIVVVGAVLRCRK